MCLKNVKTKKKNKNNYFNLIYIKYILNKLYNNYKLHEYIYSFKI